NVERIRTPIFQGSLEFLRTFSCAISKGSGSVRGTIHTNRRYNPGWALASSTTRLQTKRSLTAVPYPATRIRVRGTVV
ncbi:hypothetical protein WDU94_015361, partial [Cyamophila willieti]